MRAPKTIVALLAALTACGGAAPEKTMEQPAEALTVASTTLSR